MGVYPIQPDYYRVPEVILGCAWNMSIDIWNLGILVRLARHVPLRLMISLTSCQLWNIIQGKEMLFQTHGPQGHYQAKAHLPDMISLLGHPWVNRKISVDVGVSMAQICDSADCVTCENAEQCFDSPSGFRQHRHKHYPTRRSLPQKHDWHIATEKLLTYSSFPQIKPAVMSP
jgi:hypothetical protein